MTREEAIETIDAVDYFGMNTEHKVEMSKKFVHKIYDDFESRTCENCKYFLSSYQYVCETEWTDKSEFSCAKWEPKDE